MSFESWLYLGLVCLLGASSPGPSLLLILRYSFSDGRSAGIRSAIGHGLGVFIYALASASGLSFILKSNQFLFNLIQICGALFLIWVGYSTIKSVFSTQKHKIFEKDKSKEHKNIFASNHFRDGFIIAILNPKIFAFFSSLFSQFLQSGQSFSLHFYMACLAGFIDLIVYVVIVIVVTIKYFRDAYENYNRLILLSFGMLLILLGFSLIIVQYIETSI